MITLSPHATESYVLQYRPGIRFMDYGVAFQYGLLLRVLAVPEADCRQIALHDTGMGVGEHNGADDSGKRAPHHAEF